MGATEARPVRCGSCRQATIGAAGGTFRCDRCGAITATVRGEELHVEYARLAGEGARLPATPTFEASGSDVSDDVAILLAVLGLFLGPIFSLLALRRARPGTVGRTLGWAGIVLWGLSLALLMLRLTADRR